MVEQYSKMPPHNEKAEKAILGALLQEPLAYVRISNIISANSFYRENHVIIYDCIAKLANQSKQIDLLTVCEELKKTNQLEMAGGYTGVSELTNYVGLATHIESHAMMVQQKFMEREVIRICSESMNSIYMHDNDIVNTIESLQNNIINTVNLASSNYCTAEFKDCLNLAKIDYDKKREKFMKGEESGITTGLREFDKLIGGWQKSDLVIVGARPAMGKTAIALYHARKAAQKGFKTIFFSLEMSKVQLTNRMISSHDIDTYHLRDGNMTEEEERKYNDFTESNKNIPLIVDDKAGATLSYIANTCKKEKIKSGLDFVVIDYLQLIKHTAKGRSRENEVSEISRSLKILAKDLDVPVVLLCQLSRKVEERPSKVPILADLRESGSIEQDADIIMFPFRPAVYGLKEDEEGNPIPANSMKIYVKKHRNGELGEIKFTHNKYMSDFIDNGFEHNKENPFEKNTAPEIDLSGGMEDVSTLPF